MAPLALDMVGCILKRVEAFSEDLGKQKETGLPRVIFVESTQNPAGD